MIINKSIFNSYQFPCFLWVRLRLLSDLQQVHFPRTQVKFASKLCVMRNPRFKYQIIGQLCLRLNVPSVKFNKTVFVVL